MRRFGTRAESWFCSCKRGPVINLSLQQDGVGFPLSVVTMVTIRLHVRGEVDDWGGSGGLCRAVDEDVHVC